MKHSSLLPAITILGFAMAAGAAPAADDCRAWCSEKAPAVPLDLTALRLEIDVYGAVAVGRLVQEYYNAGDEPVTGRYRLPSGFALDLNSIDLEVAGQPIEDDEPSKSAPARGSRGSAAPASRSRGALASPQATIEPGASARIETGFQLAVPLEKGLFRLRLPALDLAPLIGDSARLASREGDPDDVPVALTIAVHHDEPLAAVESPTHAVYATFDGQRTVVELGRGEELGRRAFELDFTLGDAPTLLGYVGREKDGVREVVAVLTPPNKPRDEAVRPKEMIFVLDTSGSMSKEHKLEQARDALFSSLQQLREGDWFNIVEFDGQHSLLSPEALENSEETLGAAKQWLHKQRASGSTRLLPALESAFALPEDAERHSMIVVLSDGMVQDARAVEELLRQKLGGSRLFLVGIGKDVQRENIVRFAEIGRGSAAFAVDAEQVGSAVAVLFDSISQPLVWDLQIDWGGAEVESVQPERLPDLYAGRPVTVFARVRGAVPTELRLQGTTMDGEESFTVVLPPADPD